jgi:hypothetical protein
MTLLRYHEVDLSSWFLVSKFLVARRASLLLSHALLLKHMLHLLSDRAAVFAVSAHCSEDAAVDGAGSASSSFMVTHAIKLGRIEFQDSYWGPYWCCRKGNLHRRTPWATGIDINLVVDGSRSNQNRVAVHALPCTYIWPFRWQIGDFLSTAYASYILP